MKRPSIVIFSLAVVVCLLLWQAAVPPGSQGQGEPKEVTVRGKLVQVAVVGGETTGWAVDLDKPLQVGGKALARLEVDPADKALESLKNRQIEARGSLTKRCGIERGDYWVLRLEKIQALNK